MSRFTVARSAPTTRTPWSLTYPALAVRASRAHRSDLPPRPVRALCLVMTLIFVWTFVLAVPAALLAQGAPPAPKLSHIPAQPVTIAWKPRPAPTAPALKRNLVPLTPEQCRRRGLDRTRMAHPTAITLLDNAWQLQHPIPARYVALWKQQLRRKDLTAHRRAMLTVWLGEYELAHDEEPIRAQARFEQAREGLSVTDPYRGLAAYDRALALFAQGRYVPARSAFHTLLTGTPRLTGFDGHTATLWFKHVASCAGYHQARQRLGITEPTHLDPLCGAEALAVCLRAHGKPYSRAAVLAHCRVTGRGSNLQDLLDAADRMGMDAQAVEVHSDRALKELPKPAIVYIEHDHFTALVDANDQGVTYLCSDCGPWPGGRRQVTWSQWRQMEATAYAVLTPRASSPAGATLFAPTVHPALADFNALWDQARRARCGRQGNTPIGSGQPRQSVCGYPPSTSSQCTPQTNCSCDSCGANGGNGGASPMPAMGPARNLDTNLGNGQLDYALPQTFKVYNPIGPDVRWSLEYHSLRGFDGLYEADDAGMGWGNNYAQGVYDPGVGLNATVPVGASGTVSLPGTDSPASGLTWDIVRNGSTVASSSAPNGWSVTTNYSTNATVTVPANAAQTTNNELRVKVANQPASGFFDVLPANTDTPGSTVTLPATQGGQTLTGVTWDVILGSATIATSTAPNGWSVNLNSSGPVTLTVAVPINAAPAANYQIVASTSGGSGSGNARIGGGGANAGTGGGGGGTTCYTATLTLTAPHYVAAAGSKSLFFPNGSRVAFTAPSVPTAANPTVTCTMSAGHPYLVQWNYTANNPLGAYTITGSDRTQFITTTYAKILSYANDPLLPASALGAAFQLAQQTDNAGNTIYFTYGAVGPSGFPLLSSITDSNHNALLTFNRATDGTGNLTSVQDRYGRSVYYQVATYASQNMPKTAPQSQQELAQASQIVPTGTANPPMQQSFGYADIANGDGNEMAPMLQTVSVPSPTGAGNATATINYSSIATVASVVDANSNIHTYTQVDNNHAKVVVTDAGNHTAYTYVAGFDMNLSETSRTAGDGQTVISSATYASAADPLRPSLTEDGNGNQTQWTWDQFGNCLTKTSPRGTVTTYTQVYSNFPLGEMTQVQEGGKAPTTFTYYENNTVVNGIVQPNGRIQTMTRPVPGTVGQTTQSVSYSYTYTQLGNMLTATGPGNNATTQETVTFNYTSDPAYNYTQSEALNQPLTRADSLGHLRHMRYDARGNRTALIDALGNETDFTPNLADQIVGISFAKTNTTGSGHATVTNNYLYTDGPEISMTQANESGVTVWSEANSYGPEGEPLSRTGGTQPVQQAYDGYYRLKTLTDGNSHATTYQYNAAGYLSLITYPNGDTVQVPQYDNAGNPLQRIDGNNVTTTYTYNDPESRLTDVAYSNTTPKVHLDYDSYGRRKDMTDGTGSQAFTFDDIDNPLTVTTTYTGLAAQTLSYGYYPDGRRQTLTLPDNTQFTDTYDAAGRWTGLTNPSGQTWSWSYGNNDWLSTQTANNLITTSTTRNARGFLTDVNTKQGMLQTLLSDFAIGYDATSGNLSSVTATIPAVPAYSGTTRYSYDTTGLNTQLLQESSTRNGGYTNNFQPDTAGNLTTFKGGTNTYNNANQLTNAGFAYDHDGNPTTYKSQTLTFDAENRLTAYGSAMTAGYRGDGKRAWKQSSSGTTYYFYDGDTLVLEENSSGTKTAVNTFGPTGLLARTSTTRTLLYTFDPQGNVCQQVDASSGATVATYLFDSYGARVFSSNDNAATSEPYTGFGGMHGYVTDWETGLQLLTHRCFDPATGRFLTRDPIHYEGGINLYEYCGNSPTGGSDPSGLMDWGKVWECIKKMEFAQDCAAGILHLLAGFADGNIPNAGKDACSAGLSCVADGALECLCEVGLSGAISITTPGGTELGPIIAGCICGAVLSGIHYALDVLCSTFQGCGPSHKWNWSCFLLNLLTGGLAGCIGGVLNSADIAQRAKFYIMSLLGGAVDGSSDVACSRNHWD